VASRWALATRVNPSDVGLIKRHVRPALFNARSPTTSIARRRESTRSSGEAADGAPAEERWQVVMHARRRHLSSPTTRRATTSLAEQRSEHWSEVC